MTDGYVAIGANHQVQFEKLCAVLGVPDLPRDPRFVDHKSRLANADIGELKAAGAV